MGTGAGLGVAVNGGIIPGGAAFCSVKLGEVVVLDTGRSVNEVLGLAFKLAGARGTEDPL